MRVTCLASWRDHQRLCFNIKTVFWSIGIAIITIRWMWNCFILIMEILRSESLHRYDTIFILDCSQNLGNMVKCYLHFISIFKSNHFKISALSLNPSRPGSMYWSLELWKRSLTLAISRARRMRGSVESVDAAESFVRAGCIQCPPPAHHAN